MPGKFTVKYEITYDDNGITRVDVKGIQGPGNANDDIILSNAGPDPDLTIDTITPPTIFLTRKDPHDKVDPCGWVWNSYLKKWVYRCW